MMIGFIILHNLQLEKLAGEGEVDIFNFNLRKITR